MRSRVGRIVSGLIVALFTPQPVEASQKILEELSEATAVNASKIGTEVLKFDDITSFGSWADIPPIYHGLHFENLFVFKPSDPKLQGLISEHDLNCAVSKPNALYGGGYSTEPPIFPTIQLPTGSNHSSFELVSMMVKPLDMPVGFVKLHLRGAKVNGTNVKWNVDFPAGFHNMFEVRIGDFSNETWASLESLQIWADFHNEDQVLDWELCLDNLIMQPAPN